MEGFLRRLLAALRMGLAWGLAWFGAGMVLLLIVGPDAADVPFPLGFGMLGFFAGTFFSGVLSLAEGRSRFEEMSIPRFAGWGALGGLLFSVVFVLAVAVFGNDLLDVLVVGPVFAAAGAGSAAGALALARRTGKEELPDPDVETELPPPNDAARTAGRSGRLSFQGETGTPTTTDPDTRRDGHDRRPRTGP